MYFGKKRGAMFLLTTISVFILSHSVAQASTNCGLVNSPNFYKVTVRESDGAAKIYLEITSCTGVGTGSMSIVDSSGATVKFRSSPQSRDTSVIASGGSRLEGFLYLITDLKSGRYSIYLAGWSEKSGGAGTLSSGNYGSFSWTSSTSSNPTSNTPITPTTRATIAPNTTRATDPPPSTQPWPNQSWPTTTQAPIAPTTTRAPIAPTTTRAPTSRAPIAPSTTRVTIAPNATQATKPLLIVSETLAPGSLVLGNTPGNTVFWTVRVADSSQRRLLNSKIGARLCPVTSPWPDGPGCTGATTIGKGTNQVREFTFVFSISPNAPTGAWRARMFGPVNNVPDLVGNSQIMVNQAKTQTTTTITRATSAPTTTRATSAPTTTAAPTTTRATATPTTTAAPTTTSTAAITTGAAATLISESFSATSLRGNNPWITYSVTLKCGTGCTALPTSIAGRICVTGRSFEDTTCTGSIMGSSGTSSQKTYTGAFGFGGSPDSLLRSSYLVATINSQVVIVNGTRTIAWTQ